VSERKKERNVGKKADRAGKKEEMLKEGRMFRKKGRMSRNYTLIKKKIKFSLYIRKFRRERFQSLI
jgi:hypothetical protein